MIICVCRRLNCSKIRDAIDAGAGSPAHVMAHHGQRFKCGSCKATISNMLCSKKDNHAMSAPIIAPAE